MRNWKKIPRQPFPGPGLAVRILGQITEERVALLQEADDIVPARGQGLGGETDLEDLGEQAHVNGAETRGAAPGAWSACR